MYWLKWHSCKDTAGSLVIWWMDVPVPDDFIVDNGTTCYVNCQAVHKVNYWQWNTHFSVTVRNMSEFVSVSVLHEIVQFVTVCSTYVWVDICRVILKWKIMLFVAVHISRPIDTKLISSLLPGVGATAVSCKCMYICFWLVNKWAFLIIAIHSLS